MEDTEKKIIELDDTTKERWIKQMMDDFPNVDRLMCELLIGKWCEDPEYFDKVEKGEVELPPPAERNTEFQYNGVTIDEEIRDVVSASVSTTPVISRGEVIVEEVEEVI